MKYFQKGWRRDIPMVVPLKIQTGSDGTIAVLFSSMKDQRNNLPRNAIPDVVRSPRLIRETG